MKKLFLLLCMWAGTGAVAQTAEKPVFLVDVGYVKQGSTYGQLGLHCAFLDRDKTVLLGGLAANMRSENKRLVLIPEGQVSALLRVDKHQSGFVDVPMLMLRPQLNFSPYYFAPEAGIQILVLYLKAGYGFPWGKSSDDYPFEGGRFRFSVGVSFPISGY